MGESARAPSIRQLRSRLLAWYRSHARDLPWRRTRDAYAIWVSEIMLQQTRVETVLRYYDPFVSEFPTSHALARAKLGDVLACWSGLGYYRRAHLLHAGVREVVARYGGEVPRDPAARRALPGVGRYTAGAIGSIAFDLEEPILDGNVARVLSRVFLVGSNGSPTERERALWGHATELVRGPHPGDLNQALMELGALCCAPREPRCRECPIRSLCGARRTERVDEFSVPKPRTSPRPVALTAVVACDVATDRVWLVRSREALFRGMWLVPMGEGRDSARVLRDVGLRATKTDKRVRRVEHVLSHRVLQIRVISANIARAPTTSDRRLASAADLDALAIPALTRTILRAVHFG